MRQNIVVGTMGGARLITSWWLGKVGAMNWGREEETRDMLHPSFEVMSLVTYSATATQNPTSQWHIFHVYITAGYFKP